MNKREPHMSRRLAYGIILISAVSMLVIDLPRTSYTQTQASDVPQRAPLNPAFVEYMNARARGQVVTQTADGHPLGLIPSPHYIPVQAQESLLSAGVLAALPAAYDLRTQSKLTAVRNQGNCGTCWAFATYGSLESFYKPGEAFDFSENDMVNNHGFYTGGDPYDYGGNIDMSAAYLARWDGPVNEADSPYVCKGTSGTGLTVRKHVQNVIYLPVRASATDNAAIKQAVMTYGAVYVSLYYGDAYFNSLNNSYYCGTNMPHNHAVCIVGWDDGYSKGKFKQVPSGNGAFIVRNSWGASWGESGYFYVSYYDRNIGRAYSSATYDAAAVTGEPVTNHTTIYDYDPFGWVGNEGIGTSTTYWGANIFTAANNNPLTAVGFYASVPGMSYQVKVYTSPTSGPITGTKRIDFSGSTTYAGYYTVDLPSSVSLTSGQKFSVVIQFTTPGLEYPVPVEYAYSNWSPDATANPGESWLSSNGTTWTDAQYTDPTMNVCIKAYGGVSAPLTPITVTSPAGGASWGRGTTQTIAWDTTGLTSPNVSLLLMEGESLVTTIAATTANDGSYSWPIPSSLPAATDYSVRVKTTDEKAQGDSGVFSITAPYISVSSPIAGDIWYKGETKAVTWTEIGATSSYVKIQLYHGTVLTKTIATSAPNSGTFNWAIPKALTARTDYYLKISTTDGKASGNSGVFTLKAPTITITTPAKGSVWTRGANMPIAWTKAGPQNALVKIVLRRSGTVKLTIATSTDNDGALDWVIPATLAAGTGYDIKITTVDGVVKAISGKFSLN